ncbi:Asp-tRNA(Asn)/Glu-tRNA(Gln) amidotransferase subunit GatB [Collinsella tanakaei]|uniref:Asp-tRNA(Asn)/Glu-tRNA(Gln) amidotransferase subunit GatB n=1 Tax=Collinsella tanakaei TaxID=626935 RepID=UPI0019595AE6|nr:Asp-tRNA(Asn)/Glu-tRNA(Gln) amidotransferase subunit GatB [Collinsella tanakaei]MBM6779205.1 Asp-tRNA(Asn)/Glu-tRNA(Gln) amidotransferase subunit GatB [Collinsella tanakaei]
MKELSEVLKDWEAVIGLEIHTELTALDTKMFCNCKLSHEDEPNANVCPVCLGLPGALPVPNKRAIESIVKAGLATNCEIQKRSMFYRKHYFYPDMAKNFQTTQGPVAFCMHGRLDLEVTGRGAAERPDCAFGEAEGLSLASASANAEGLSTAMAQQMREGGETRGGALAGMSGYDTANLALPERHEDGSYTVPIRILRIHMEEDAAKMVHVGGEEGRIAAASESLIDYNRCGTPLIELVTEPDLRTPEEARLFMEKLRRIFLTLGISDCSMEHGSMRCDGNVSLRRRGETKLGTKTELKNLNSFKALHDGLAYEICRQAEVLEEGGIIYQETRHWEPGRKRTVVMRVKETADDYRLFPDPDLAPFDLSDEFIEHCRSEIPELPDAKRDRFEADFGIKRADAEQIAGDPETAAFFEESAAGLSGKPAQAVANLIVNELAAYLKGVEGGIADCGIAPAQVASLAKLLAEDAISSNQAHEVFGLMAESGEDPEKIVDERGMRQVSDAGALQPIVDEVLARCADQAQQYRDGNQKVLGFLVGQCMKASRGQGNPKLFNELLRASLS